MDVEESVRKKLHASKEKIDKYNLQKSEGNEVFLIVILIQTRYKIDQTTRLIKR